MKFIFQKRILIFSVIFFILTVFIFSFLLITTNKNKTISQSAEEKLQEEINRKENIKHNTSLVQAIESERASLESHFIQSSDAVVFLNTIEKLAKNAGTKPRVDSVKVEDSTSSLVVEMGVLGSFENIYKLITLLENSPYDLEFILVDIRNPGKQDLSIDGVPDWQATLKIRLKSFVNQMQIKK